MTQYSKAEIDNIKKKIYKKYALRMMVFVFLTIISLIITFWVNKYHLSGHSIFSLKRNDDSVVYILVGFSLLGLINSLVTMKNSIKILNEKCKEVE